jgi:hypothetical protein
MKGGRGSTELTAMKIMGKGRPTIKQQMQNAKLYQMRFNDTSHQSMGSLIIFNECLIDGLVKAFKS